MSTYVSPEVKLRALAQLNSLMIADLGTGPGPFRWFNAQLNQNAIADATAPGACVTVTRVGTPRNYNMGGLMPLSKPRLQIDIYDQDSETARTVAADVIAFMAGVNLANNFTQQPTFLIDQKQRMLPNPTSKGNSKAGPIWVQMLEYRIYNDEGALTGGSQGQPTAPYVRSFAGTFTNVTSVTLTHNLNTASVEVAIYDPSGNVIEPQSVTVDSVNTVTLTFGVATTGAAVVMG